MTMEAVDARASDAQRPPIRKTAEKTDRLTASVARETSLVADQPWKAARLRKYRYVNPPRLDAKRIMSNGPPRRRVNAKRAGRSSGDITSNPRTDR
jgi:hypothetical protein